eukprot:scaffold215996_cov32-Tisochrysis_lutea.AAC.2
MYELVLLADLGIGAAMAGFFGTAYAAVSRGFCAPPGPAIKFAPLGTTKAQLAQPALQTCGDVFRALVPTLFVVAGAISFLYGLLFLQARAGYTTTMQLKETARKKGEKPPTLLGVKYLSKELGTLWADRSVGNFLEQFVPFLVSLFAYALFVSANRASALGWIWLFFRGLYPLLFGKNPALLLSTIPAYSILWYMLAHAVYEMYML